MNYEATDEVFSGETSVGIDAHGFNLRWSTTEPVPAAAYKSLRFAIHPGDTDPGRRPALSVYLNVATSTVRIVGDEIPLVDLEKAEWQEVEIPLSDFFPGGEPVRSLYHPHLRDSGIEQVRFIGTLRGTFHVDDVRFVTGAPSLDTAVLETRQNTQPNVTALGRNYPNPFNAETIIPVELTEATDMTLTVYNLSGQRVTDLLKGYRPAGVYHARWNGFDDTGHHLASGAYLIRLHTDSITQTRKLLLLR